MKKHWQQQVCFHRLIGFLCNQTTHKINCIGTQLYDAALTQTEITNPQIEISANISRAGDFEATARGRLKAKAPTKKSSTREIK